MHVNQSCCGADATSQAAEPATSAQRRHSGLLVQIWFYISLCVPAVCRPEQQVGLCAGYTASPMTLWCRLLPAILSVVSQCALTPHHGHWLSKAAGHLPAWRVHSLLAPRLGSPCTA